VCGQTIRIRHEGDAPARSFKPRPGGKPGKPFESRGKREGFGDKGKGGEFKPRKPRSFDGPKKAFDGAKKPKKK